MQKGILIYALGHSNYYRMAEVLAASLIVNGVKDNDIAIGVICDDTSKFVNPQLFDDFIVLEPEQYQVNGKVVFNNATVLIYDLSPYDITMKLDADMIWINGRNPGNLFKELEGLNIAFSNRGYGWNADKTDWAEEDELREAYKLTDEDKLYRIYGEFLYFRKNRKMRAYFEKVKAIYNKPKVNCLAFSNGTMTDELAFQIACMLKKIYPHQDNFTPIYNQLLGYDKLKRKYPYELKDFYGYSIGGNRTDEFTKNNYDHLAQHYYNVLGLTHPYKVQSKRSFLAERRIM